MALGIAAFCLVAILGLIPVGLSLNAAARRQTEAVSIMSSVAADLRGTPSTSGSSCRYLIPIASQTTPETTGTLYFPASGGGAGQFGSALQANSLYCVGVTTQAPTGGGAYTSRRATWAMVRVSWPASNTKNPLGFVETTISLDRN